MRSGGRVRTAFAVAGAALIVAGVALMLFAHRHVHTGAGLVVAGVVMGGYTVEAFRRGGRDQTRPSPRRTGSARATGRRDES